MRLLLLLSALLTGLTGAFGANAVSARPVAQAEAQAAAVEVATVMVSPAVRHRVQSPMIVGPAATPVGAAPILPVRERVIESAHE